MYKRYSMKQLILTVSMVGLALSICMAQANDVALKHLFTSFDTTSSAPDMTILLPRLDIYVQQNPANWASHFYSAYARIRLSLKLTTKDARDQCLDAADASLLKAGQLSPNNEEIFILQAYSAKARIAADPGGRWKKYGDIYSNFIAKEVAFWRGDSCCTARKITGPSIRDVQVMGFWRKEGTPL